MEALIFIGIQGAGKSSFFKERFFDTHVRVSRDLLRTKRRQRLLFEACLAARQRLVIDNTNVTAEARAQFIAPAKAAGFRVVGYYFPADVRGALLRNSLRAGAARVPEVALFGTLQRLEPPRREEGFDDLFRVRIDEASRFVVEEWDEQVARIGS